jgi:hypothetical protein
MKQTRHQRNHFFLPEKISRNGPLLRSNHDLTTGSGHVDTSQHSVPRILLGTSHGDSAVRSHSLTPVTEHGKPEAGACSATLDGSRRKTISGYVGRG